MLFPGHKELVSFALNLAIQISVINALYAVSIRLYVLSDTYTMSITLDQPFVPELLDQDSQEFHTLAEATCDEVSQIYILCRMTHAEHIFLYTENLNILIVLKTFKLPKTRRKQCCANADEDWIYLWQKKRVVI